MATLQEDVADYPLVKISSRVGESSSSSSKDVDEALDAHEVALGRILGDADVLRLSTLKLMEILTPLQAVDLLVASKKLHLSIHEWGKRRDLSMGKMQE
ncbi:hypothetical protein L1049_000663 [Liquidambar formosana]|uniref:DOG1 domain-containing protein n=1 Tax=Liquidambar formosana TaxID=63359 RepID=A0AAP0NA44_LIQFO